MAQIFLKPAVLGNIVRHHDNRARVLPKEGELVEEHREWLRRIELGDAVLCEQPKSKVVSTKEK